MFHLAKKQNQKFIIFENHSENVDFEQTAMKLTKIMKILSFITLRTVKMRTQDPLSNPNPLRKYPAVNKPVLLSPLRVSCTLARRKSRNHHLMAVRDQ